MISHSVRTKSFQEPRLSKLLMVEWHPRLLVEQIASCRGVELVLHVFAI